MNSPGQRRQGPRSDYPWEQQALDVPEEGFISCPYSGQSPADAHDTYRTTQREKCALTDEALTAWTPPSAPHGRRRAQ